MVDGVHPVFLVVLETVAVVVEVALLAGDRIGTALRVEVGAIHAADDLAAGDLAGEDVLEGIGDVVHVGVDAAGVEHAARPAAADVLGIAAVVLEPGPVLVAVHESVAIRIGVPGVGGPELVPPARVDIVEAVGLAGLEGVELLSDG